MLDSIDPGALGSLRFRFVAVSLAVPAAPLFACGGIGPMVKSDFPKTLTVEEVMKIHDALVVDFAQAEDPIAPAGVRSMDLLESAVARQHTGFDGSFKYEDAIHNAATLLYGLCCDHPFHNGNKRIALVAMLCHLEKNSFGLYGTNQNELYDFMVDVAGHALLGRPDPRARSRRSIQARPDEEVAFIAGWLEDRADGVEKGERLITYRQLRGILRSFGLQLENPHGNSIDVVRYVEKKAGIFAKKTVTVRDRVCNIGWPGEGAQISKKQMKRIREMCHLTEEDGVDSYSFYSNAAMLDFFVSHYRKLLRRLART